MFNLQKKIEIMENKEQYLSSQRNKIINSFRDRCIRLEERC
jgi:hypothetical protein